MSASGAPELIVAPNITPDRKTGIGRWTDEEIKEAIRSGIGRDGHRLNPEMPYDYFKLMTDDDTKSIIAYLRSLPPVSHQLPRTPSIENQPPHKVAMETIELLRRSEQINRGEYLVRLGACETCHTPSIDNSYLRNMNFAGGVVLSNGGESAASSNLTPDPSGIPYYDKKMFVAVMRSGHLGGRRVSSIMPWLFYGQMRDDDLAAILEYLRALPAVRHNTNNYDPPRMCRLCKNRHGLGELN